MENTHIHAHICMQSQTYPNPKAKHPEHMGRHTCRQDTWDIFNCGCVDEARTSQRFRLFA